MDKLGKVTGRPAENGLHVSRSRFDGSFADLDRKVHPITPEASELGDEITVVTSEFNAIGLNSSRIASRIWVSFALTLSTRADARTSTRTFHSNRTHQTTHASVSTLCHL
jgi:hypothetical protein